MNIATIIDILRSSIVQILMLAGPILVITLVLGLLISIFQATTSIQDQTLTFVPKIIAAMITFGLLGGWMLNRFSAFAVRLMELMPQIANGAS